MNAYVLTPHYYTFTDIDKINQQCSGAITTENPGLEAESLIVCSPSV